MLNLFKKLLSVFSKAQSRPEGESTDAAARAPDNGTHQWSDEDEIVALFLYRFPTTRLPFSVERICDKRGIPRGSMKSKRENFRYLDTGKGLPHRSEKSRMIWERHKGTLQEELKDIVLEIICPPRPIDGK